MDPAARYYHELRLAGVRNGPTEPVGRGRSDRKEIGGYGFAAQVIHSVFFLLTADSNTTSSSVVVIYLRRASCEVAVLPLCTWREVAGVSPTAHLRGLISPVGPVIEQPRP